MNNNLDASIDTSILETELNKINGLSSIEKQGENDSLPWTVTVNGFKFQIKEDGTVESVEGISLSPTVLKIVTGESETITATKTEGVTGTINWTSSDDDIVTVNNGTVTAVGSSGTATITASVSGTDYNATCEVTIVQKVTQITLSASSTTVKEGNTLQLSIATEPATGEIEEIEFSSSDPDTATVNNAGLVRGVTASANAVTITATGKSSGVTGTINITVEEGVKAPTSWVKTTKTDSSWYSYGGATVNEPKLTGGMTPIKYNLDLPDGANTTNKWANAITSDGSMFVWIPRYAYKINYTTEGSRASGTIDVAFVKYENGQNVFLNGESGTITTDPTEDGAGTTNWLVHPAFVNNVNNGGWDSNLSGIWVGKFEATGTKITDSNGDVTEATISVLPGTSALVSMKIKDQYKYAKLATFGETATLNSHMAKNSEWGAIVYLAYSEYGRNGVDVAKHPSNVITGASSNATTIYTTNYPQSTTNNPYGVYGLRGGAYEYVASYVNYGSSSTNLLTYGGTESGDLYGSGTEPTTSTRYKTVYQASGTSASDSYNLLASTNKIRGDAIFETSTSYTGSTSWHNSGDSVSSYFPTTSNPFFVRGGGYNDSITGLFYFDAYNGGAIGYRSFRVVLCP